MKFASIHAIFAAALLAIPTQADGLFTAATAPSNAEQTARSLTSTMDAEIARRVLVREQSWRAFWENPRATPQEILSALGTDAVKALTASTVDAAWFKSLAQATGKPLADFIDPKFLELKSGWSVSLNTDGTATATPPAE